MRIVANIIWLVPFLGIFTALVTFLFGLLLTILIIPAPIGLGLIQLAKFELTPFSSEMVNSKDLHAPKNPVWDTFSTIITILYFPFGLLIALVTVFQIIACCLTIIGIPIAIVLAKSLTTYLNPVNKICVARDVAILIARQKAEVAMQKHTKSQANAATNVPHSTEPNQDLQTNIPS